MTTKSIVRSLRVLDNPEDFFYDDDAEARYVTEWTVTTGDDTYNFKALNDASKAAMAIDAALAEGREPFPCSWLVSRFHPEPDSPSDLIGECGSVAFGDPVNGGFTCVAGHSHDPRLEYFDADEIAGRTDAGISFPANAARMDGASL
jgi:hypothetical protein